MKKIFFDNTSTAECNPKQHSYAYYLDKIKELGLDREFAKLEAHCTDGDIRPKYPYQWVARSTTIPGDDDPFEGIGSSPLEASKKLYEEMKEFLENYDPEEDPLIN